jgi:hypothetical protein
MGGAKTVNAQQYISKRDPSRDIAIAMMMQQAQQQQLANQAEMLKQYAGLTPEMQTYDPSAVSRRAAELGTQNILRQRELDRLTSPEAAAMRLAQSKEIERLTSPETSQAYMREYMRTQGLPSQYETGLGDSTIGRAAMYDRALQAKKAYEDSLALQQQAYLAKTAEPVGGISPESSISAQLAAQSQNLAAQEAYKQGMLGAIGGYGQSAADSAMQQFRNLAGVQQAQQQSQQAYNQMLLSGAAQNAASQNAMRGAYISAAGNLASGALGAAGSKFGSMAASRGISGYDGQQYTPKMGSGGEYYAPVSGSI